MFKAITTIAIMVLSLNVLASSYVSDCGTAQLKTDRGGVTLEITKVSEVFGQGAYEYKAFLNNGYGTETSVAGLELKLISTRFIENNTNRDGVKFIVYSARFLITADETIDRISTNEGEVVKLKTKEVALVCSDRFEP